MRVRVSVRINASREHSAKSFPGYCNSGLDVTGQVGGTSFLKTVNTLQVALQKHKGGDGPSKHEVHLQRCQEVTNACHTTAESQAVVVTPLKVRLDSLGSKSKSTARIAA